MKALTSTPHDMTITPWPCRRSITDCRYRIAGSATCPLCSFITKRHSDFCDALDIDPFGDWLPLQIGGSLLLAPPVPIYILDMSLGSDVLQTYLTKVVRSCID